MQVGVIADIHADVASLHLALNLLHSKNVDKIICAGDLIDKGPDGDGVIALIRERAISCVRGNHDQDAIIDQQLAQNDVGLARKRHTLTAESLDFLAELPSRRLIEGEGNTMLLAHGTPWSDMMYVFPTSKRNTFKAVAREAWSIKANVVILGHTHIPMIARIDDVWILNSGSVCRTYSSGSATCGILSLPSCTFDVFRIANGQRVSVAYVSVNNMQP